MQEQNCKKKDIFAFYTQKHLQLRDNNIFVKLDISFATLSWNENRYAVMQISRLSPLRSVWITPIFINQIKRDPVFPVSFHVRLILETVSKKRNKNIIPRCLREWKNARASTSKLRQSNSISVDFYTVYPPTTDRYTRRRKTSSWYSMNPHSSLPVVVWIYNAFFLEHFYSMCNIVGEPDKWVFNTIEKL